MSHREQRPEDDDASASEVRELYETTREICSSLDLDEVLSAIVRRANRMLDGDVAYLGVCDDVDQVLRMRAHDNVRTEAFRTLTMPYGLGLGGAIAARRTPMAVANYQDDQGLQHRPELDDPVLAEGLVSSVGAPVEFQDQLLAVLFVARRVQRGFSDHQMTVLASLANAAAVAIRNAQVHGRLVRANSVHDKLMAVALGDLGPHALAQTLAELISGPVVLLDWRGRAVSSVAWTNRTLHAPPMDELLPSSRSLPLRLGGEIEGWLLAEPGAVDSELALVAVEQAATVFALELAKLRSAEQTSLRLRGGLLAELLSPPFNDEAEIVLQAQRLGCDLRSPHLVAVVRAAESGTGGSALSARQRQRVAVMLTQAWEGLEGGGLVAERGTDIVVLVPSPHPPQAAQLLERALARGRDEGLPSLVAGTGSVVQAPLDYAPAFAEAGRAVATAQRFPHRGAVVTFEELEFYQILLGARPVPELLERARFVLAPLLEYDEQRGGQLLRTARVYLDCGGNAEAAARRLAMHPNGLRARIVKISELLGRDLNDTATRLNLQLALEALSLRQSW